MLGFGAGDEDIGGDAERERVEFLLAGDVLDGLVEEAALNEGFVCGLLIRREAASGVGVELGARDAECVQEEEQCIAGGVGAQVG